ncbi:MAG: LacI family DNA-binding transcriptional regulator, partial [Chloroflexota bacterium]
EAGYREAMLAAGLDEEISVIPGDHERSTGLSLGGELLAGARPPTAVFCCNDEVALGVMDAAHRRGWRVGQDLAIVGFDDTAAARAAAPALTTVHQPLVELAQQAVGLLFGRLDGRPASEEAKVLPSRLIVRESCGAAFPDAARARADVRQPR